jgi:hypothetical protein
MRGGFGPLLSPLRRSRQNYMALNNYISDLMCCYSLLLEKLLNFVESFGLTKNVSYSPFEFLKI